LVRDSAAVVPVSLNDSQSKQQIFKILDLWSGDVDGWLEMSVHPCLPNQKNEEEATAVRGLWLTLFLSKSHNVVSFGSRAFTNGTGLAYVDSITDPERVRAPEPCTFPITFA
jgi:hypothetical protein